MKNILKFISISAVLLVAVGIKNINAQCQAISASIVTAPAYDADTILRICPNTLVTFTGIAVFGTSGAGATYDWKINNDDGGWSATTTMAYNFTLSGVYVVDFIPTDAAGCIPADCNSRIVVHVAPKPSFDGTALPDSICQGVPLSLSAAGFGMGEVTTVITPDSPSYECAPPISDTTFLPDGSGVSYSTSINVECFTPCDTLEDGDQILGICMIMEHSYLGDLDWTITCPSGLVATIKQYPGGGGTYLGGAVDDGSLIPGIGAEYCFSDLATRGTMLAELALGTTVTAGVPAWNSMAPGSYKPFQSFDNLIGCPLNGDWTITVTDHLGIDNGYIFGWWIDFDFTEVPEYQFHTEIVSFNWDGPAEIFPGTPYTIIPEDTGVLCYTLTVLDNFGCEFDTTLCTFSKSFPSPGMDSSASICPSFGTVNLFDYLGGEPELGGFWTGTGVTATGLLNPAAVPPGLYVYTYVISNTFCDTQATVTMTIENDFELDFMAETVFACDVDTVNFTQIVAEPLIYYRWNYGDGTPHVTTIENPTHLYETQALYDVWFIGVNEKGCIDSVMKSISTLHPFEAAFTQSKDSICQHVANNVAFFDNTTGAVVAWDWSFGDGNTSDVASPTHTYTDAGIFDIRLVATDNLGCTDTAFGIIFVDSTPTLKITFDKDEICGGDQVRVNVVYAANSQDLIWNFGDGSIVRNLEPSFTHSYPYPGQYIVTVTSEQLVCPDTTVFDTVFVKQYPQINLGADDKICLRGAPIMLDPTMMVTNPPGTIYYWSTGDSMAVLKITEPGVYRVYANLDGCITTDEIEVNKDCYTDVPNSFTPNDDGSNDYFYPRQLLSEGIIDFKMVIYNRWGELIFETNNPDGRGWDGKYDGKDQPMGVYVYQISVRYKNQTAEKYSGNVTLLR